MRNEGFPDIDPQYPGKFVLSLVVSLRKTSKGAV